VELGFRLPSSDVRNVVIRVDFISAMHEIGIGYFVSFLGVILSFCLSKVAREIFAWFRLGLIGIKNNRLELDYGNDPDTAISLHSLFHGR